MPRSSARGRSPCSRDRRRRTARMAPGRLAERARSGRRSAPVGCRGGSLRQALSPRSRYLPAAIVRRSTAMLVSIRIGSPAVGMPQAMGWANRSACTPPKGATIRAPRIARHDQDQVSPRRGRALEVGAEAADVAGCGAIAARDRCRAVAAPRAGVERCVDHRRAREHVPVDQSGSRRCRARSPARRFGSAPIARARRGSAAGARGRASVKPSRSARDERAAQRGAHGAPRARPRREAACA